jgi:hypothetical protein
MKSTKDADHEKSLDAYTQKKNIKLHTFFFFQINNATIKASVIVNLTFF